MAYEDQKLEQSYTDDDGQPRGDECQCDVCGRLVPRLHTVWAYGIETYACDRCAGYPPEEGDEDREEPEEGW